MLYEIASKIYSGIRARAGLTIDETAAAIGKSRSIVYRMEKGEQILKPDVEAKLLTKANLSKVGFFEVICDVLTEMLGRPVRIAPKSLFLPEAPLKRAADLYASHVGRLSPEARASIEAKLHTGRLLNAAADQYASQAEKEIRALLEVESSDGAELGTAGRGGPAQG